MWKKFTEKEIEEFIKSRHFNHLFCNQSIITGYALCRGICCDNCSDVTFCNFNNKCNEHDRDYCIRDIGQLCESI